VTLGSDGDATEQQRNREEMMPERQQDDRDFESTYAQHHGAGLVRIVLALADCFARRSRHQLTERARSSLDGAVVCGSVEHAPDDGRLNANETNGSAKVASQEAR
jgi:hypothetical protein